MDEPAGEAATEPASLRILVKALAAALATVATARFGPEAAAISAVVAVFITDGIEELAKRRKWGRRKLGILTAVVLLFSRVDAAVASSVAKLGGSHKRLQELGSILKSPVGASLATSAAALAVVASAFTITEVAVGRPVLTGTNFTFFPREASDDDRTGPTATDREEEDPPTEGAHVACTTVATKKELSELDQALLTEEAATGDGGAFSPFGGPSNRGPFGYAVTNVWKPLNVCASVGGWGYLIEAVAIEATPEAKAALRKLPMVRGVGDRAYIFENREGKGPLLAILFYKGTCLFGVAVDMLSLDDVRGNYRETFKKFAAMVARRIPSCA